MQRRANAAGFRRGLHKLVVRPRVGTEAGEAPGWQGATSENGSAI